MPVRFRMPSETGGVVVKEIVVGDDGGGKTGGASRRDKLRAIKIRILPRKKQRPTVSHNPSKMDSCHHHNHHPQQQQGGRPTIAKRTRFSCWSSQDSESQHLHHYDVVADDVTYWSAAATTTRLPYSSCNDCDLRRDDDELQEYDDDDGRRRRSYRTAQNSVADAAWSAEYFDEVFEDSAENEADWRNTGHQREVLRPMNAGSVSDRRRQRGSQPLPPRHRTGGPRPVASNAATAQGDTERTPAPIRRTQTDLETAEIAAGHPEVYDVGDAAPSESLKRQAVSKKTQDYVTRGEDSKKPYDDQDGYYIHIPHDWIAYR